MCLLPEIILKTTYLENERSYLFSLEFFLQHLMKNEVQPSFDKRWSIHFGEISTLAFYKTKFMPLLIS